MEQGLLDINKIKLGDNTQLSILITAEMHNAFIALSGDNSPVHTSEGFALANGFKKTICHGFLLTTLLSKIYGTMLPGGSELCLTQSCQFKLPFYVDDELTFYVEVTDRNESLQLVTIKTHVKNQHNEIVFRGVSQMKLSLSF